MGFSKALMEMLDAVENPPASVTAVDTTAPTLPAPSAELVPGEDVVVVALEDAAMVAKAELSAASVDEAKLIEEFDLPPMEYRKGGERHTLIFQGVCSACAHCGMPLTDADSIQMGIGPICRKRAGFNGDPAGPSDENQALIDLAEFPQLMELVSERYKPRGARVMMNFLVRLCSLNRRSPVHAACTDAIDSLGYAQLASVLRESIKVIEISEQKADANNFVVWVKKSEWNWGWSNALRTLPGARVGKYNGEKGTILPKSQKPALWNLMKKFYGGYYAKTPSGCVKITPASDGKMTPPSTTSTS